MIMSRTEEMLRRLQEDVEAASMELDPARMTPLHVQEARARIAALPAWELVERLVWAQRAVDEWIPPADNFDDWEIALIQEEREKTRKALDRCATALEVTDG